MKMDLYSSQSLNHCSSLFLSLLDKENSLSMLIIPYLSFYLRLYIVYFYIDINIYCILFIAYRVNRGVSLLLTVSKFR